MIFASPNAPYFENWGRTPGSKSILYSSAPGDLNKYLHDTFAITSPDPILFGSHGFVQLIMFKVFHLEEFNDVIGTIQQKF